MKTESPYLLGLKQMANKAAQTLFLKKTKMYTNTDQIYYFSQMILILKYAFH
jgi:hypothetical protein